MFKRKMAAIFIILLGFLCSCGRGSIAAEERYNPGTDYQYFQAADSSGLYPKIQETEEGCFLYHDQFIYRYEQGGNIVPLCSKINCLHDKEANIENRTECNAYLDHILAGNNQISLMRYKDSLYVCYPRSDVNADTSLTFSLYCIAADGSSKDEVFRCPDVAYPLIHRGYMYYYTEVYSLEDRDPESETEIVFQEELHQLSIEDRKYKDKVIMKPKDAKGFSKLSAYGNHVYFSFDYYSPEGIVLLAYNTQTENVEETKLGTSRLTLYQDKYYLIPGSQNKDLYDQQGVYISDYLGNTEEEVIRELEKDLYLVNDGKYLYINNGFRHFLDPEEEITYQIYDSSFKMIDEFTLPDSIKNTQFPLEV
ncbi:MAG: hypothetical protein IIY77_09380, partial [Lachnospiraceae bacterium]|nr:hypothetical protein [Lachnospiraceae bacterium]